MPSTKIDFKYKNTNKLKARRQKITQFPNIIHNKV